MTDTRERYTRKSPTGPTNAPQDTKQDNSESMHHQGNFGNYMHFKNVKLREQFDVQSFSNQRVSGIFEGVTIFVNGYTVPSHQELKQLMALHGGRFENYFSRHFVTHIICNNLPDTKLKQMRNERKPIPIVKAGWVVDSISAGRLLPVKDFALEAVRDAPNQLKLAQFQAQSTKQLSSAEVYPALQHQHQHQHQHEHKLQHQHQHQYPVLQYQHEDEHKNDGSAVLSKLDMHHTQRRDTLHQHAHHSTNGTSTLLPNPIPPQNLSIQSGTMPATHIPIYSSMGLHLYSTADKPDATEPVLNQCPHQSLVQPPFQPLHVPTHCTNSAPRSQTPLFDILASPEHSPKRAAPNSPGPLSHHPVMGDTVTTGPPSPSGPGPPFHVPGGAAHGRGDFGGQSGVSHDQPEAIYADQGGGYPGDEPGAIHADQRWFHPADQPGATSNQAEAMDADEACMPVSAALQVSVALPAQAPAQPMAGDKEQGLVEAQAVAANMRAACDVLRGPPRSSHDDPSGFVSTFFRSSRLHFIGTWKARVEELLTSAFMGPPPTPHPAASGKQGTHKKGMPPERSIIHLDMDCFFASATSAGRPELQGKPLAVCHSNSAQGCGEVSTANYEARVFGIKSGMFIAEAKKRCPNLIVVPYEFDRYEAIADKVYRILLRTTCCVQPLSCDEAFLDVTGLGDAEEIAAKLRAEIFSATACTASAGIGPNLLLARLATSRGKPNGQYRVRPQDILPFLQDLPVDALPGVGWSMRGKLSEMGINKVCQVWGVSRELLQRQLGQKTGLGLWNAARGVDERRVEPPGKRKSVGAEVNWGVRFGSGEEQKTFVEKLAGEVAGRMIAANVKGRTVSLKLKRRQANAPEPAKFLGHGFCDNISRSETLPRFTNSAADLMRSAWGMLTQMAIPFEEVRGVGIQVSRLDNDSTSLSAKPSGPPPAKLAAPPRSTFDPNKAHPWFTVPADKSSPSARSKQDEQRDLQETGNSPMNPKVQDDQSARAPVADATGTRLDGVPKFDVLYKLQPVTAAQQQLQPQQVQQQLQAQQQQQHQANLPQQYQQQQQQQKQAIRTPTIEMSNTAGYPHTSGAAIAAAAASTADASGFKFAPPVQQRIGHAAPPTLPVTNTLSAPQASSSPLPPQQPQQPQAAVLPSAPPPPRPPATRPVHASHSRQGTKSTSSGRGNGRGADVTSDDEPEGGILALPPASQVDQEVLDALPLVLRRELEQAYGLRTSTAAAVGRGGGGRAKRVSRGGRQGGRAAKRPHTHMLSAPASVFHLAAPLPPAAPAHPGPAAVTTGSDVASTSYRRPPSHPAQPLRLTQVDPDVLAELPLEIQQEILNSLQPPTNRPASSYTGPSHHLNMAAPDASNTGSKPHNFNPSNAARSNLLGNQAHSSGIRDNEAHQPAPHVAHYGRNSAVAAAQASTSGGTGSAAATGHTRSDRHALKAGWGASASGWGEDAIPDTAGAGAGAGTDADTGRFKSTTAGGFEGQRQTSGRSMGLSVGVGRPHGQASGIAVDHRSEQERRRRVFLDEDPRDVMRMLRRAVEQVVHGVQGVAGGGGDTVAEGRNRDSKVDGGVSGQRLNPALIVSERSGRASKQADLEVMGEIAAQWMMGLEGNLEGVSKGLRLVSRLGQKHPAFSDVAKMVVDVVQAHVKRLFGFKLLLLQQGCG